MTRTPLQQVATARRRSAGSNPHLEALAREVGAVDILCLRRRDRSHYDLVGGAGRGGAWAGQLQVSLADEPALLRAFGPEPVHRLVRSRVRRFFGPYHAQSVAVVTLDRRWAVVFGALDDGLTADDGVLLEAARAVTSAVVSEPGKRQAEARADDAALEALRTTPVLGLQETMDTIVRLVTDALSCDVGVLYLAAGDRVSVIDRGWPWPPHLATADIRRAMASLWRTAPRQAVCHQDLAEARLPHPLGPTSRLVSSYLLPVGSPAVGLLAVAHSETCPRGFTDRCRALGAELAAEAASVLTASATLDAPAGSAEEVAARLDPPTGLPNATAWDEALSFEHQRSSQGGVVITIDLPTDARAGDRLAGTVAGVVRSRLRQQDFVARVGRGELAVLLARADSAIGSVVAQRLAPALVESCSGHSQAGSPVVMGWAARPMGGTLADAHRIARDRASLRRRAVQSARTRRR